MRLHTDRLGIVLLACAMLVLLQAVGAGGAGGERSTRADSVATGESTSTPVEVTDTAGTMVEATDTAGTAGLSDGVRKAVRGGKAVQDGERVAASESLESPGDVRALYVTGWTAGSARMDELIDTVLKTGLNGVVIELKAEDGVVSYPTSVPLAGAIGADSHKIRDLAALVRRLHAEGLYVIGRIVAFQDELLATAHPEWALRREGDGEVWRDAGGRMWTNPASSVVRAYLYALALEAAEAGVDEVQWDYVRFPSDGDVSRIAFTHDRSKSEVIASFLRGSRERLHEVGVAVSADLFGFAAVVKGDVGIGQRLEAVTAAVDYASLMVYPSHFAPGSMGIPHPDSAPGQTVYESMRRAAARTPVEKHRPWIQAFSLKSVYTEREVAAQIAALRALGIESWILWNASNHYEGMIPSPALVAAGRMTARLELEMPEIRMTARVEPAPALADLRLVR